MTVDELRAVGEAAGLVALGVTGVEPFTQARQALEARKAAGLHAGMQFTYRNPARSTEPARLLPDARSLLVGAYPYAGGALGPPPCARPHGQVARYATDDHYAALRDALGKVAEVLDSAGYATRVVADDNALVDRAAARRAGLGWSGKNANVLVPGHGSWVVLGTVVTDADLTAAGWAHHETPGGPPGDSSPDPLADSGPDPVADGCGSCRRCLDHCPTGAIVAPGVVDARRCLAWLVQADGPFPVEHRVALGGRLYGCDDCQEVCPPSTRGPEGRTEVASTGAWVDLLGLLDGTDDELLARHGRWYVPKRDPRYLRRNALVVLGNVADPADAEVLHQLARWLDGPDELLAEHARWALDRLADRTPVADDTDDTVAPASALLPADRPPEGADRGQFGAGSVG